MLCFPWHAPIESLLQLKHDGLTIAFYIWPTTTPIMRTSSPLSPRQVPVIPTASQVTSTLSPVLPTRPTTKLANQQISKPTTKPHTGKPTAKSKIPKPTTAAYLSSDTRRIGDPNTDLVRGGETFRVSVFS